MTPTDSIPGDTRPNTAAPEIVDVRRIWDQGAHNAFTDLVRHQGRWFCVFREAADHIVSPNGAIRIITSEDGMEWESAALLRVDGEDLRDPKLTVTPDGRLMLSSAGALLKSGPVTHQSYSFFSDDGITWSRPISVGDPNYWLWRTSWHKDMCYGVGYSVVEPWTTRLYHSNDGLHFSTLVEAFYDDGSPNETSIVFLPDDSALCLLRSDSGSGLLGKAAPPYVHWDWQEVGPQIGGPDMVRLPDGQIFAGVRLYDGRLRTSLCQVDLASGHLDEVLTLPSGGDTSYPGMVWQDGMLWVSYYSSHEGKTSIYLARIRIPLQPVTRTDGP